MKTIGAFIIVCGVSLSAFAGDTNYVDSFKIAWRTHNASNILEFVEQNVATNASPEALFGRGLIAVMLQSWRGATNHFEQSIHMIATNGIYSSTGKTNIIQEIRLIQSLVEDVADSPLPTWNTNRHTLFFSELVAEPIFFDTLEKISIIESAEK